MDELLVFTNNRPGNYPRISYSPSLQSDGFRDRFRLQFACLFAHYVDDVKIAASGVPIGPGIKPSGHGCIQER